MVAILMSPQVKCIMLLIHVVAYEELCVCNLRKVETHSWKSTHMRAGLTFASLFARKKSLFLILYMYHRLISAHLIYTRLFTRIHFVCIFRRKEKFQSPIYIWFPFLLHKLIICIQAKSVVWLLHRRQSD